MGRRVHLTNIYWEFTRFQVVGLEPRLRGGEVSEMSKTCTLFTERQSGVRDRPTMLGCSRVREKGLGVSQSGDHVLSLVN